MAEATRFTAYTNRRWYCRDRPISSGKTQLFDWHGFGSRETRHDAWWQFAALRTAIAFAAAVGLPRTALPLGTKVGTAGSGRPRLPVVATERRT